MKSLRFRLGHILLQSAFAGSLVFVEPGASVLAAQPSDRVAGQIVNAEGEPVAFATIRVDGSYWSTLSTRDGAFALVLPIQSWTLTVARLGYAPVSIAVTPPNTAVIVRLRATPVELKGVSVSGQGPSALSNTLTTETIRQVPPLLESDLFRAVVLLPGVSQPNDLKGRIHLAGGSSDETGVRLDGHPLQDPFHLLGVLGAFNVAALDAAQVRIHHLPVDADGWLSGLIDLESRQVSEKRENADATLGILSAGFTYQRSVLPGDFSLLLSARTTYLDRLLETLSSRLTVGGDELTLLGYRDALIKVGHRLGNHSRLELLGFATRDERRTSGLPSEVSPPYVWAESLYGIRLNGTSIRWKWLLRASQSHASADLRSADEGSQSVGLQSDWWSASMQLSRSDENWGGTVGVTGDERKVMQAWSRVPDGFFIARTPRVFAGSQSQFVGAAFMELSARFLNSLTFTVGNRFSRTRGTGYAAPRILLRLDASKTLRAEAAFDRRLQFSSELDEPQEGTGRQPLFLAQTPRIANVFALSLESVSPARRRAAPKRLQAIVFSKLYSDRTKLNQDYGSRAAIDSAFSFPRFDRLSGRSYGATISLSQPLKNRAMFQGSYTFQRVFERRTTGKSPTTWDVPHSLSLFASLPLSAHWSLNSVLQARNGAAIAPVQLRVLVPESPVGPSLLSRYIVDELNSARLPAYYRLDIGTRREWRTGTRDWALSLQVVNALARRNALELDWAHYFCRQAGECAEAGAARSGLPLIPSISMELKW